MKNEIFAKYELHEKEIPRTPLDNLLAKIGNELLGFASG